MLTLYDTLNIISNPGVALGIIFVILLGIKLDIILRITELNLFTCQFGSKPVREFSQGNSCIDLLIRLMSALE